MVNHQVIHMLSLGNTAIYKSILRNTTATLILPIHNHWY